MSTMNDKILETKKLEDFCNALRDEMSQLQNQKRILARNNFDTHKLEEEINFLKNRLVPSWEKFEILLGEIGSDTYYNYLKELRFKEMNNND